VGYPFGQFGPAVPALSPLSLWPTLSLLTGRAERKKREGLDAVQALLSNSQNIGLLSMLLLSQI